MNKLRMNRKTLLFALIALLLVTGGWLSYTKFIADKSPTDSGINYGPPTDEEKKAGDEQKEEIVKEKEEEEDAPPQTKAIVVISDANQYGATIEVRAFVSNVYEEGTCTVTFTQGSSTLQKQVEATKEASNTQCKPVNVARSEFSSAGIWNVTVAYASANSSGESKGTLQVK